MLKEPAMATTGMEDHGYAGIERRRHRVFLTRNTEYHFRDGICVSA
jgi:hypothetical protein